MTMFKRKLTEAEAARLTRVKDAMAEANANNELRADSLLDKLRASKWTGWILIAAGVLVVVLLFRAF